MNFNALLSLIHSILFQEFFCCKQYKLEPQASDNGALRGAETTSHVKHDAVDLFDHFRVLERSIRQTCSLRPTAVKSNHLGSNVQYHMCHGGKKKRSKPFNSPLNAALCCKRSAKQNERAGTSLVDWGEHWKHCPLPRAPGLEDGGLEVCLKRLLHATTIVALKTIH